MLVSVCIPTYNRCGFIRLSARYWLEQLGPLADRVELIIADNASTDGTGEMLNSYREREDFRLIRRPENLNFNRTTFELVAAEARGDFVRVCGDDDLPNVGALALVVEALEANRGEDHFYVTTQFVPSDHAPDLAGEDPRESKYVRRPSGDSSGRLVRRTKDLLEFEEGGFSGFYSSIWRREVAIEALSGDFCELPPFASLEATLPYAVYIARHRLEKPCYRIGVPLLTVMHTISWPQYAALFRLKTMPDLYDLYLEKGASPALLRRYQLELLDHWPRYFGDLIRRRRESPEKFSFLGYLFRYGRKIRFWKELFRYLWCDLLP